MAQARRARRRRRPDPVGVLGRLLPVETTQVLFTLLQRHPDLKSEAEDIAKGFLTDAATEDLAREIEDAVLAVDVDEVYERAGRKSWGYVDPVDAAWELLERAVEPFVEDLQRKIDLGYEAAAVATCQAIVLGLYRCRGQGAERAIEQAEDFLPEAAQHAVDVLAARSGSRRWRLPPAFAEETPEWPSFAARKRAKKR